jgi:hypothetical protein
MTLYLVSSDEADVELSGTLYRGVRCGCAGRGHYFHAVPLEEADLAAYPDWPLAPSGGRRRWLNFFVSNSCALPGTAIRLRLADGPRRLSDDLAQWFASARSSPILGALRPLSDVERGFIAEEVKRHIDAMRSNPSFAAMHRLLVDSLLWVWTADAYSCHDDCVVRDAFKYSVAQLRHTEAAHQLLLNNDGAAKGLIHEHAVPRNVLINELLVRQLDVEGVRGFLSRFCFGVIVTAAEDREELAGSSRARMPHGWKPDDERRELARYPETLRVYPPGQCPTCLALD